MRSSLKFGFVLAAGALIAAASVVVPRGVVAPAGADTLPAITVGDVSVWEGNAGSAVVYVPVDMSVPSPTKVKVHYTITGTTATAGEDFSAKSSGWLTFAAGKATNHIRVLVYGDTTVEPDENLTVTLDSPVGATLEQADGGVTILDDDSEGAGPAIQVNVGSVDVVEADAGHHTVSVPISLSQPAPSTIKVKYVADCATALPGSDYDGKYTGTLTFNAGQQSKLLTFTVVADYTPEELVKQFLESVTVALGPAVVGNEIDGGGEIIDNDNPSDGGTNPVGLALGQIARESVASDGSEGDSANSLCGAGPFQWGSMNATMSGNGRYVAFTSDATNLVPNDNNNQIDSFVHDLVTGETQRISVQSDGSEFTADYDTINPWQVAKSDPSISYDGHYATFTDVYTGRVYLRDLVAQTTELITVAPDGSGPNYYPSDDRSSVSADGRYVAFTSIATNLVVPNPPAGQHLYLRDRLTQTTRLITTYHHVAPATDSNMYGGARISADGRYVVFQDSDGDLVAGDTNGCVDVFVYDVANGTFERESVGSSGQPQTGCVGYGDAPVISSDGRYVGFSSSSRSLAGAAPSDPALQHAYLHDRVTGTTTMVDDPSLNQTGEPATLYGISDDGRYATWSCEACGDMTPDGTTNDATAYWTDLQTGETQQIGMIGNDPPTRDDTGGGTFTQATGMSADGTMVAFSTWATNLIPDDTNGKLDVYVERML